MNILALEPYYGGSHKAFLDGWAAHSRHRFTILSLPPRKWKWRMRHAALTFATDATRAAAKGQSWDVLCCSDMLNLAEFLGLAPEAVRRLPCIAYFHENQLTYPFRYFGERDFHFGFTNMTTAAAATQVWFNSAFHRDDLLTALTAALKRMPDFQPLDTIEQIRAKSHIHPPGVVPFPPRGPRPPGPLRILWAARWEHDKNPELFFEAISKLKSRGVSFRLSVIGEQFKDSPAVFDQARATFQAEIDRWGYQPTRADYESALRAADVVVSTADHEFFGISIVEALAAGCFPLVPRRLAYPEVLGLGHQPDADDFFHNGTADALADRLAELAARAAQGNVWVGHSTRGTELAARYAWTARAPEMDRALEDLTLAG